MTIERIWVAFQRYLEKERIAKEDARLTAAILAHACDQCGFPLDDDGLCEDHQ